MYKQTYTHFLIECVGMLAETAGCTRSNLGERLLQEAAKAKRACTKIALPEGMFLAGRFKVGAMCVTIVNSMRQTYV
jgi:hypothetical protein